MTSHSGLRSVRLAVLLIVSIWGVFACRAALADSGATIKFYPHVFSIDVKEGGTHKVEVRGSSLEFAQYRKYVPGDDTRRLDWRTWGRSDRFYIKEFEADTNLRCCLVVDTSGSMDYGSGDVTKIQYARKIAGALGTLAVCEAAGVSVREGRPVDVAEIGVGE